jgi:2-keto-4-pentenoate hydratase/2-oxohepta-3-ene-1,7-dioic acid hydratase in catechol pathway
MKLMKLVTFESAGDTPRVGALTADGRGVVDLGADFASMLSLIDAGERRFQVQPLGRRRRRGRAMAPRRRAHGLRGGGRRRDRARVLGPCIVTADELTDPYSLVLEARVNGELRGAGRTGDMHHRWEDLIAYIGRNETLYAGEVIGSGTVANGCGLEIGRFLPEGALVEISAEGIGTLCSRLVRA